MMLKSDISLETVLPVFVNREIDVAFLAPTATHIKKHLIDAVSNVRQFLVRNNIHDYAKQKQGLAYRRFVPVKVVGADGILDTQMSLNRPMTKKGDPRLWIPGLKDWCRPNNLLAMTWHSGSIYIFNMSDHETTLKLLDVKSVPGGVFSDMSAPLSDTAHELLSKLKEIHKMGFVPSEKHGDTCIGMTLEKLLGIPPNSLPVPDYKGIELKSKRIPVKGHGKSLQTLFAQVPDWKRSPFDNRRILEVFGKENLEKHRRELNCTVKNVKNAQGLWLEVREKLDDLVSVGETEKFRGDVVVWSLQYLKDRMLSKHKETFWVAAESKVYDGKEFFRYDSVVHTRRPQVEQMPALFDDGTLSVDILLHTKPTGSVRDRGYLFRMPAQKIATLFPNEVCYDLSRIS